MSERSRIFGRTHPLVASTQVSIAEVDFAGGLKDAALATALDAEREGRAHLLFTARYLPERVAFAYAARRPRGLDLALSAALAVPDRHADALDALIRSRGLVLDELAARATCFGRPANSSRQPPNVPSRPGRGLPTCWFAASMSRSRDR